MMTASFNPEHLTLAGDPNGVVEGEHDSEATPSRIATAVQGSGPLVVCVHGWPELWYSWRHQMAEFGGPDGGYRVAAIDVRGYGGSSTPYPVSEYSLTKICADVAAVIEQLGGGPAILFGHDWGAPIVWNTARLYPDHVRAVCGLSVPYVPIGPGNPIDLWRALFTDAGQFFYQVYFQDEGRAEAEFSADSLDALRKIYHGASYAGMQAETGGFLEPKPVGATMLAGLSAPDPFPNWLSETDLEVFASAFDASGWRGPLNRYRAQGIDGDEIGALPDPYLKQPAAFITGVADPVRRFLPGEDVAERAPLFCNDFRGSFEIPNAGHWVQQEQPEATNAALRAFLGSIG